MEEDFKPIETQEEFNERIKDRLERESPTVSKQIEGRARRQKLTETLTKAKSKDSRPPHRKMRKGFQLWKHNW